MVGVVGRSGDIYRSNITNLPTHTPKCPPGGGFSVESVLHTTDLPACDAHTFLCSGSAGGVLKNNNVLAAGGLLTFRQRRYQLPEVDYDDDGANGCEVGEMQRTHSPTFCGTSASII